MNLIHYWDKSYKHKEGLNGVQAIYINNMMRTLAWSLGGLFSPLYIFLLGYEQNGLAAGLKIVILSIVVERVMVTILALPVGKLVYHLGFKWSVLIAGCLLSIYFLLPSVFGRSLTLVIVMSIIASFEILFYWIARLSLMSLDGERSHYGREVSFIAVAEQLVSILGPFVGGYLIARGGFPQLFTVVTVVSVISALPMFFVRSHKIADGISLADLLDFVKRKENRHLNIAFLGQGINSTVDGFFWPVFFFLAVKSFETIGGIASMVTAVTVLVVYLAGKRFDRLRALGGNEDERSFTLASLWMALLSFTRPLFSGIIGLTGYNLAAGLSSPFWWIPYDSYLYSAGKKCHSPLAFFTYRELILSMGRFGAAIGLFFVVSLVPISWLWWVVFGFGSLGILLGIGMQKES